MKSLLLFAMLTLTSITNAKKLEFFYSKLNLSTLVTSKTDWSYLRQSPSTQSPYLMYGCRDETCDCRFMWSNRKDRIYNPSTYPLSNDKMLLAATDRKHPDFYRVVVATNSDNTVGAYVAKRATKPAQSLPITRQELRDNYFGYWLFPDNSGLRDVIIGLDSDELYGVSNIMLGTIQGNLLIFAHSVPGSFVYDDHATGLTIEGDANNIIVKYGPKQCRPLSETSNYNILDLGKLTADETEQLLLRLQANQMPNSTIVRAKYANPHCAPDIFDVYYGDGGNGDFTAVFSMDLSY